MNEKELIKSNDSLLRSQEQKNRRFPFVFVEEEKDGKKIPSRKDVDPNESFLIEDIVGTPNKNLAMQILQSGIKAMPNGIANTENNNYILQTLADATPRDAHEARLTVQATALYAQGMTFLERAADVLSNDNSTFAKDHWHAILMKSATKLLDLHNKTIDALTRYRQQGEQRITVQHVNIENGGKAVIGGTIVNGGGGTNELNK